MPERDALISAAANRRMFDAIARRYDRLNFLLSLGRDRYWRRQAIRVLAPAAGGVYLDLGAGTGDVGLEIIKQEPGARVIGVDPATAMLALGRGKTRDRGLQEVINFVAGDAAALSFPDAVFAGVSSAFCLRNLADRTRAWTEMWRVLRPGGRVVILELTRPENILVRLFHGWYNRLVLPLLGRLLSTGEAYAYLAASIAAFPAPESLLQEMREAGFDRARALPLTFGSVNLFVGERPGETSGRA